MYVHHMCAGTHEGQRAVGPLELGHRQLCWELHLGPFQKQQVFVSHLSSSTPIALAFDNVTSCLVSSSSSSFFSLVSVQARDGWTLTSAGSHWVPVAPFTFPQSGNWETIVPLSPHALEGRLPSCRRRFSCT